MQGRATMAIIDKAAKILNRIQVKLYPNYLPEAGGAFLARSDNQTPLNIEQICAAIKTREDFSGNYEDLLKNVQQFFDEAAYQLCNGFSINTGYFSIHPKLDCAFNKTAEAHNFRKHPINFRFCVRPRLRRLAEQIVIDIEGLAGNSGYIDEFIDLHEDSINSIYVPGDVFTIYGHKIKVAGTDPGCGLFFVPVEDPSKAVKVTLIAENTPSRISGIAPKTEFQHNRIEIRSQYTSASGSFLYSPRVISSSFILEEA